MSFIEIENYPKKKEKEIMSFIEIENYPKENKRNVFLVWDIGLSQLT